MKAIITIGLPSSDKDSYATKLAAADKTFVIINRDKIRRDLFDIDGQSDYSYNKESERLVSCKQFELIREAFSNGKNVIISDTNLRMKYVRGFVSLIEKLGHDVEIKMFDITLTELIRRRVETSNSIPASTLIKKAELYNEVKDRVLLRYPYITEIIP